MTTVLDYRKKPVVVQAIQFEGTPESANAVFDAFDIPGGKFQPDLHDLRKGTLLIPTLEGEMTAGDGDYIIRGVAGEFYPCRADIFEATYELIHLTRPTPTRLPERAEGVRGE